MLSKAETTAIKGFAILLVLFHHLFWESPVQDNIFWFAMVAKVGVAIFVTLSGYGLAESLKNSEVNWKQFYIKRAKNIYPTFWLIFILGVTLGAVFFGRSVESLYGSPLLLNMLTEFFGLQLFRGIMGFANLTWWYMSLIIALYLIFPAIYTLIKEFKSIPVLFAFALYFTDLSKSFMFPNIHIDLSFIGIWILPFSIGIYSALHLSERIQFILTSRYMLIPLPFFIYLVSKISLNFQTPYFAYVKIHFLLSVLFILLILQIIRFKPFYYLFYAYGNVSYEIFLFHTFIYFYFFRSFIYSFDSRSKTFLVLSLICLIIGNIINAFVKLIIDRTVEIPLLSLIKNFKRKTSPKSAVVDNAPAGDL